MYHYEQQDTNFFEKMQQQRHDASQSSPDRRTLSVGEELFGEGLFCERLNPSEGLLRADNSRAGDNGGDGDDGGGDSSGGDGVFVDKNGLFICIIHII